MMNLEIQLCLVIFYSTALMIFFFIGCYVGFNHARRNYENIVEKEMEKYHKEKFDIVHARLIKEKYNEIKKSNYIDRIIDEQIKNEVTK